MKQSREIDRDLAAMQAAQKRESELAGILSTDAAVDRRTALKYLRGGHVVGQPGSRLRAAVQALPQPERTEVLEARWAAHKAESEEVANG